MPPRARLRLAASQRLARELEFAGETALRRMALAAEAAARQAPRDGLVSEAWLFERVTGVKSRDADATPALVGQAVAMDLAALALRLSERAPLDVASLPGGAVALAEAARRLGVSPRSLQRWKREGLAMVRVRGRGGSRTALSGEAIEWCRSGPLARSRPARREPGRRDRLVRMAGQLAAEGDSLHALARRVAARDGASLATVRRALAWGERTGAMPRLRRRTKVDAGLRAAAWRAWRRGTGLAEVAGALGRSDAAALRLVRRERRDRLRALRLEAPALPTFVRADAAQTLLAPRAVCAGLSSEPWPDEAHAFLRRFPVEAGARSSRAAGDSQRLVALRFLLWRGSRAIASLRGSDPGAGLDEVETWLRWAGRLRLSLVERALPGALGRLQAMRQGPLRGLPPAALRRAVVAAVEAAGQAVEESMRGERSIERPQLAALAAALVERATAGAAWLRPGTAGRETAVELPANLRERCVPWIAVVPLRDDLGARARIAGAKPRVVGRGETAASLDTGLRLLVLRYGWAGDRPRSAREASDELALDARRAAALAAQAFRALRPG